ncbi:outer membrane beta-barrel protein [Mucilaginibacter lacusdianchii]|uniref:outer membrane beta-barrel protein n=1 Tax=Mucilaginibacter lacusdianchii TaxID=2684211 RepID=UPI00131D50D6|nr:outer membrane beta-barrel protein [Mucilaginibacter sp. JXJ CY 39]
MKPFLFIVLFTFIAQLAIAQVPGRRQAGAAPPLPVREVSGVVKDSTDEAVIGATVKIKTATDSISTTTNADGIFVFKNVKSATFVISITSIGFRPVVKRMLNNDAIPRLVLDPFVLRNQANALKEVIVNGTPSITYKTDTVEYRASDYKVRPNSSVDELLKKMEGMEVGSDGSVTHQGQQVVRARVNGKDYSGGDVAQAIQNLPADIVEKIQVVDDYGDQAARTGIKDGDPQKVLNITTRADRSVGNIIRLAAGGGNNDRYESRVFLQRLNGNQQVGLLGSFRNTVNGVASTGVSGGSAGGASAATGGASGGNSSSNGSGGTTTSGNPSFSYRDQWSKKVQVNGNYTYNYTNVHTFSNSYGEQFSGDGTTSFINNSDSRSSNKTHRASFEFEYTPDSANFLRITPSVNFSSSNSITNSSSIQSGFANQNTSGLNTNRGSNPTWGGIVFYQHIFNKPRRNFSIQLNYNNADQSQENEPNTEVDQKDANGEVINRSIIHRYVTRDNSTINFRTSMTYVEPLSTISQLEFNAQVNNRSYHNKAFTDSIDFAGNYIPLTYIDNVFDYKFTESRFAVNYRLNQTKFNLSVGATAVPTTLSGDNVSKGTTTHRNYFNLIPIFRFQYVWSRQQRASINYSGNPTEPSFNQIQPVPDQSNALNTVFGNPDLRPSFRHSINALYNNYLPNSKINISANINGSIITNQIVSNRVTIRATTDNNARYTRYETYYLNMNGSYNINGNYNFSKQLADRRYNLSFLGNVTYANNVSMLDNARNLTTVWRFNERFGPRINPNESIEINPFVAYDVTKSTFKLPRDTSTTVKRISMNIDGKVYLFKNRTFNIGYSASKNLVYGITSRNPLVINASIEKEFFSRRLLTVNLQVFDILKQNNFIDQVTTTSSVTNTVTNALSRYLMLTVRANLQKWTGSPRRNGRELRRRGDGSFIVP